MRCDGKPVRPGTGTTHRMSKASEPDKQNGTLFADSIRASSPNRLRQQAGQKTAPDQSQHVKFPLATREPSTEDLRIVRCDVCFREEADMPRRGYWPVDDRGAEEGQAPPGGENLATFLGIGSY